jgi:hypothetical protein
MIDITRRFAARPSRDQLGLRALLLGLAIFALLWVQPKNVMFPTDAFMDRRAVLGVAAADSI